MTAITIVGLKRWNEWKFGVVGCTLAKEFLGNTISRDPNVVLTSEIGLVDGTILLSPFVELEKTVLIWHVWYTADNWEA